MALAEDLTRTVDTIKGAVPPDIFAAIGESISDLEKSGVAQRAANVGAKVEPPVLKDLNGHPIDLRSATAGSPYVLMFYRGGWCPYCNVTLQAYVRAHPELERLGAKLVAVTPEMPGKAIETAQKNGVPFIVAIDAGNTFARSLGLVFDLPLSLRPQYRQIGIDLPEWNGDESHELPIAATYVVDAGGTIRWAFVDANFTSRAEPADVLAAVKTLAHRG